MESLRASTEKPSTGPNLMTLPSELHIQISAYLCYPDALALKHTSRHFYYMVCTGVRLKVDWLIERFERKLECPMEKCSFSTDEAFCNVCIRGIMERRRWHLECRRAEGGCLVIHGGTCQTGIVPVWFKVKAQGWRQSARIVESWGQEVLVSGLVAILLQFVWCIVREG